MTADDQRLQDKRVLHFELTSKIAVNLQPGGRGLTMISCMSYSA